MKRATDLVGDSPSVLDYTENVTQSGVHLLDMIAIGAWIIRRVLSPDVPCCDFTHDPSLSTTAYST